MIQLVEHAAAKDKKEDKDKRLRSVHRECGLVLFKNLDFEESFDHFSQSDADPRFIMDMYPGLLSRDSNYRSKDSLILISERSSTVSSIPSMPLSSISPLPNLIPNMN